MKRFVLALVAVRAGHRRVRIDGVVGSREPRRRNLRPRRLAASAASPAQSGARGRRPDRHRVGPHLGHAPQRLPGDPGSTPIRGSGDGSGIGHARCRGQRRPAGGDRARGLTRKGRLPDCGPRHAPGGRQLHARCHRLRPGLQGPGDGQADGWRDVRDDPLRRRLPPRLNVVRACMHIVAAAQRTRALMRLSCS